MKSLCIYFPFNLVCETSIKGSTFDYLFQITYLSNLSCSVCLGWLEPLLDRIAKDPTTVVCPVIDVIDDTTLEYNWRDSGGVNVGGFDWNLQVKIGSVVRNYVGGSDVLRS